MGIIFNIVLQLIFGIPIELVHGAIVFFIYEVGVIMGGLACALSDPYIAVVGCSGGVYCLFGIHVAHMMLNWKDMKHSAVPREMRVLVFGMLFGSEVVAWWCLNTAGKSFAAHAGGALAGFLMGVGFMTNFEIEEWEVYMRWFCRFCFAFFVVLGVIWYVAKDPPSDYAGQKNPFQQCNDIRAEIVHSCQSGFMKEVAGSNCADDPSAFTTGMIGEYKHYFSTNE